MKTLLLLVSLLTFGTLCAQPKVLSSEEYRADRFDYEKLLNEYPAGLASDIQAKNRSELSAAFTQILAKEPLSAYSVLIDAFINETGTLDLVTFHLAVAPVRKQALLDSLRKKVPDRLKNWKLEEVPGRKMRLELSVRWQSETPYRTMRTGDSLISTLEEARTTLDTLKIKSLHLHQLDLAEVPYEVIYRFPNLETLDLHQNKLTALNLDMARLPRLKNLDLRGNQLSQESIKLTKNRSLKILNVHTNRLTDIPDAAQNCKELESLWMGGNKALKFSNRSFRKLRAVHDLNLYGCELTMLPGGIRKLRGLEVLDLYYNALSELPKPVTRLRKLSHLAVAHNQITTLPARIDRLKRLQMFYIHHNHLSTLPDRMPRLMKLQLLDLGYNWFSTLPPEILALPNLRELDLSGNNLNAFPAQLSEAHYLEKLHLRGNPFLRNETEQAYLPYIQKLEKNPTEVYY